MLLEKSPAFPAAWEIHWRCVSPARLASAEHCPKCHQDDNMMYLLHVFPPEVRRASAPPPCWRSRTWLWRASYQWQLPHQCRPGGSWGGASVERLRMHAVVQTSGALRSPGGLLTERTPGPLTLLYPIVASFKRAEWDERSGLELWHQAEGSTELFR